VISLCQGYELKESAAPCGGILREALKYDVIAALILYHEPSKTRSLEGIDPQERASGDGIFWRFFDWIDKSAFEISADAFNTFKVRLYNKMNPHLVTSS
jgi:calcium binding protein 39